MTAKSILQTTRARILELRRLDAQLARCLPTGKPAGVRVQQYDAALPGTNDPTAAAIQLYEGLMAARARLSQEAAQLTDTAWGILRHVPDVRTLAILSGYYLLGQTDQQIAQLQGLSREHVNRLRCGAVSALPLFTSASQGCTPPSLACTPDL